MEINIISIHQKIPNWINIGISEYLKRFPKDFQINLIPILPIKRIQSTREQILQLEALKIEKAVKSISSNKNSLLIALDEHGREWSTKQLSKELQTWQNHNQQIIFIIGGSEGLSSTIIKQSHCCWSLSKLTLPHLLAQLIIVEQLYRAICILKNHPYHRE